MNATATVTVVEKRRQITPFITLRTTLSSLAPLRLPLAAPAGAEAAAAALGGRASTSTLTLMPRM
jgi:hypothetical protein